MFLATVFIVDIPSIAWHSARHGMAWHALYNALGPASAGRRRSRDTDARSWVPKTETSLRGNRCYDLLRH